MISKIILLLLTPEPLLRFCTIDIQNPTIGPTKNEKKYGIL